MITYTSEQILKSEDLYELQSSFSGSGIAFKYELTASELSWLSFVKGRYSIAEWIEENLEGEVLTFNYPHDLSQALHDDGVQFKAVCLSDDTALQKLFFWLSDEIEEE